MLFPTPSGIRVLRSFEIVLAFYSNPRRRYQRDHHLKFLEGR